VGEEEGENRGEEDWWSGNILTFINKITDRIVLFVNQSVIISVK